MSRDVVPEAPLVTVIHEALAVAAAGQPDSVVSVKLPAPPAPSTLADPGEIV